MKQEKTLITDFTEGNVMKQLLIFATPLFLSNLLQIVYNMVDMVVVGWAAGKVGLSAVSVGGDVSHFLTFLAMGFSNAGQVIISQYIGAGRQKEVGRFIGNMFSFLISCAIVISVGCLFIREPILSWMNTPKEAWDQTLAYATTCMIGLVFIYGYNIVSAVLRGLGDAKHPFRFISIAAVLNVILDIWFVLGMGMGAFGAALATVISQAVSFVISVIFLAKRKEMLGFEINKADFIHMDKEMLTALIKLGIPMAIKNASVQFTKLFVNSWINSYGMAVSAVAGIASKFASVSNLASNSVNTAGSSMVGQNIGAGKYKRVPRIMACVFIITFTITTILTAAVLMFPKEIFGIFTKEADVLAVCMEYLPIAVLVFFGSACRAPSNALINGSGNYKVNFAVAMLDGFVMRIGLSVLFGLVLDMKYIGFWLGDACAGFTPMVIAIFYYLSGTWKTRKYAVKGSK
ncbi:MAG: MATE family efflux transporter [Lachnospiraceae bacterium]|nr:MATE family efflux transporter [Lachnospiraceae bacterium]